MIIPGWLHSILGLGRNSGYRDLGDHARNNEDWAKAAHLYGSHLRKHPRDFDIWVQLGHARKEAGDISGAYDAYMKGMGLRANDADLLLNIGRLLRLDGRLKESIAFFLKSYYVDDNPHALNELKALVGDLPRALLIWIVKVQSSDHADRVSGSGFFDADWYERAYPDVEASGLKPLEHYVTSGAYAWRSPGPDFDSEWYLLQNPELVTANQSKCLDPLMHFLDFGRQEGRTPVCPHPTALAAAQAAVEDVIDLEPLLYANETFLRIRQGKLKSLKILDPIPRSKSYAVFRRVMMSLDKPYDHVIAVPSLVYGGAELMAMHMARAITQEKGARAVLVLATDSARDDARNWLPANVDFVSLRAYGEELGETDAHDALLLVLQALAPKTLINVNSRSCWDVYRSFGKALSQVSRLYGCAFCRDYNDYGFPGGYADTHVRDTLPWLTGLISDNASFFDALQQQFLFPASFAQRFITLYNPAPDCKAVTSLSAANAASQLSSSKSFKVLWASRFTAQKNLTLLMRIVEELPLVSFDVWGRGEGESILRSFAESRANFNLMGPYASFHELPVRNYAAFLYTSRWDGIPNVLLEAAAAGLPLISSAVGGIGELVDHETGFLIEDLDDPRGYVKALNMVRQGDELVFSRRDAMFQRLARQHSWDSFVGCMGRSGILDS